MKTTIWTSVLAIAATVLFTGTAVAGNKELHPAQIHYQGQAELMKARAALMNAQANIIKAIASARQTNAQALSTMEQTRGVAIDNSMKYAKTYYDRRQARDTYLAMQAGPQRSPADSKNVDAQQTSAVRMQGLTTADYNPNTRELNWPKLLEGHQYTNFRKQLQEVFAQRDAADAGVGSKYYVKVRRITDQMKRQLRRQIRAVSPSEYLAARKFLDRLVVDAVYAPQHANVAEAF